jgi:hypothetical protein
MRQDLNRRSLLKSLAAIAGLPVAARAVAPVSEVVFHLNGAAPAFQAMQQHYLGSALIKLGAPERWVKEITSIYDPESGAHKTFYSIHFAQPYHHTWEDVCPDPKV